MGHGDSGYQGGEDRRSLFRCFGVWLRRRRNFLILSVVCVGLPPFVMLLLQFREASAFRDPAFLLFAFILCVAGGYVWGVIMWKFFKFKRQQWRKWGKGDA